MQPDGQMAKLPDGRSPGPAVPPSLCQGQAACLAGCPCPPTHRPVSPMPLCPKSPRGGPRGERPAGGTEGSPTLPLRSTISHPVPSANLAFSSETCDLPTTLGEWACPGAGRATEPHRHARSTGFWRDWQEGEGPGGQETEAGGFPGFPGTPFPCCLCSTHAFSRTHSCAHVHRTHSYTHTSTHTITHAHTLTQTHMHSHFCISSTHIRAHTYICAHTLLHTHSRPRAHSHVPTRMHTHWTQSLSDESPGLFTGLEMNVSSRVMEGPEDESGGKARWPGRVTLGPRDEVGVLHAQSSKQSCPSFRPWVPAPPLPPACPPPRSPSPAPHALGSCNQ